jgi:paraquat-inducible protein B
MTAKSQPADTPTVQRASRPSLGAVWIAPIIAAIAVGYLIYDDLRSRGPMITISFDNAEGIVAGKSDVKYKGVVIGSVRAVHADATTGTITVQARLEADAVDFAKAGAQFWIQNPEISLLGVGSLDTLISGPYIACVGGDGATTLEFTGLSGRPPVPASTPGLRILLTAEDIGSLEPGSPVIFRGIPVGEVDRIGVASADDPAQVDLFIDDAYRGLVQPNTYFFEMSGIHANIELPDGLRIDTRSVQSIVNGGVGFHTPPSTGEPVDVADGAVFEMHRHPNIQMHNAMPITITFADANGIEAGSTQIRHDGVNIGIVTGLEFTRSFDAVKASALLYPTGRPVAVSGSEFWVVHPEIGLSGVRALDTLVNGVYIDSLPGQGEPMTEFQGLASPPAGTQFGPGLNVELRADSAGSIRPGAPVYYREIIVGEILSLALADDATAVVMRAHIEPRFAPLVHEHTEFWNASGISISGGLAGIKVKTESLESVLAGGVAFATPTVSRMGRPVSNGAVFQLHASPQDQWLDWDPSIPLTTSDN